MAINLGSAYGKVSLDASGVQKGVDSAVKSVQTMQMKMAALGQTMSDIGGKMTLGLTLPLALFAKSAVDSSNQSQEALANLKATIESTGGVAGVTAEQAIEMATAFQKVTKFSDEAIINGEAMLLTFTNIGKDVFPQATEAMLNMAQKFGSIDNAAIQLGKALQDPINGVTALRRVGVNLTQEQEDQIKHFMAVNDIASAQKIILAELEKEFGGLAEAIGETDAGKIEQLKNAFDDLKEVFGDRLKKAIIPFVESLTKAINDFLALPEPVKNSIVDIVIGIGKLVAIAGPIIFVVGKLLTFASMFLPGGALAGVGTFITTSLLPAFSTFFTFITATAIPAIVAFAAANAWWIVPLLIVAATVYLVYLAFKNNFMGITTAAKQLWFILKYYFTQGWDALIQVSQQRAKALVDFIRAILDTSYKSTLLFEDGSGALLDLAVAFGIPEKAAQDFLGEIWLVAETFRNLFQGNIVEVIRLVMLQFGILSDQANQAFLNIIRGATLLYEDGSGALLDLAVAFGIPEKAAQDFLGRVYFVASGFTQLFKGNMLQAVKDFAMGLFGITNTELEKLRYRFMTVIQLIVSFFSRGFGSISSIVRQVMNGIGTAIDWVVSKIQKLQAALANLKLPKNLTPGSPTPFENGLRGIASAMDVLTNKKLPNFQSGLSYTDPNSMAKAMANPVLNQNSSSQQNNSFHFASGLTIRQAREMMEENNDRMFGRLSERLAGA